MSMKILDVRDVPAGADAQLAVVENPRHRHMLKNYRRHGLLEVSGLWQQILIPEMTVEHPVYRLMDNGVMHHLDGMDAVANFYRSMADSGNNVFGPLEEQVAVSDYGIFSEALFAWVVPGTHNMLASEGVEPDKVYQVTEYLCMSWPYVDGRLQGEHVYEDISSRQISEVDASAITTPAQAREILAPYLAETPLEEIVDGLSLFSTRASSTKDMA